MRLSTKGIYALEATLYLALQDPDSKTSVRVISEKTELSERYLEQIFTRLKQADIICSIRGKQGGYFLARPAAAITAGDVLRAAEGDLYLVACIREDGREKEADCKRIEQCPTRPIWKDLHQTIGQLIDQVTIADLVRQYKQGGYEEQIDFVI